MKEISSAKIILMGELIVNLPVTVMMVISVVNTTQIGMGMALSCIIGSGVGWFFWGKLIDKWKNWALSQNIERERIFRLGKLGLINFHRNRIFDEDFDDDY